MKIIGFYEVRVALDERLILVKNYLKVGLEN